MSTLTKIASAAAVVAISASSAFALQTVETSVPTSLQNSRLADAEHIDSVTVNVEQTAAPASIDETLFQTTGRTTTTVVATAADTGAPESLRNTRLLQR